eukprot:scaffold19406_cov62-Phaeocystis_antarctica.AAC.4
MRHGGDEERAGRGAPPQAQLRRGGGRGEQGHAARAPPRAARASLLQGAVTPSAGAMAAAAAATARPQGPHARRGALPSYHP